MSHPLWKAIYQSFLQSFAALFEVIVRCDAAPHLLALSSVVSDSLDLFLGLLVVPKSDEKAKNLLTENM